MTANEIEITEREELKKEKKTMPVFYNEVTLRDILTWVAALIFFISLLIYKTKSTTIKDKTGYNLTAPDEPHRQAGLDYAQMKSPVSVTPAVQPVGLGDIKLKMRDDIQPTWMAINCIDSARFLINFSSWQWLLRKGFR